MTRTRVAVLLLACDLTVACQAFEPTIRSRQVSPARDARERSVEALPPHSPVPTLDDSAPLVPHGASVEPVAAHAHIGGEERVDLELRDIPLAQAIHTIAESAGISVYLDATLDERVDASFKGVTRDDALHAILARNGLALFEDPPGIYYVARVDAGRVSERRFVLRSARVADVEPNLKALVAGSLATRLVVDAEQNFVLVRGPQSDIDLVGQYLESADRLKSQVLIEVSLVEVNLGSRFELGLSHALANVDLGDGTLALLQEFTTPDRSFEVTFDSDDGDLSSTLQALESYAGVELLSSPRVMAVNNTEATIEIVREIPYIQATTSTTSGTTGGVGTSSTEEVAFKEVGIKLKVRPSIRAGGVIELDIAQELSEVAEFLNSVPAVDTRNLTSKFQVRDRNTLAIGGLMQDRTAKADRGVPGLMNIPWLGRLFKSDEDTVERRELVLFLTPRIVTLEAAQGLSESYREVYAERRAAMGLQPEPARAPQDR